MKIERLEDVLSEFKKELSEEQHDHLEIINQLNEVDKVNVGLSKDREQLQYELNESKRQIVVLEGINKEAVQEKQEIQQKHNNEIKQKDAEIKTLDMEVYKLQSSLEAMAKTNDQLNSDIKNKTTELSDRILELDRLNVRYELTASELKTVKTDLKAANKAAADAEKLVSNLEGQLMVYKSLDKAIDDNEGATE